MLHKTADLVEEWGRVGHGGGVNASGTRICGRKEKVVKEQQSR